MLPSPMIHSPALLAQQALHLVQASLSLNETVCPPLQLPMSEVVVCVLNLSSDTLLPTCYAGGR